MYIFKGCNSILAAKFLAKNNGNIKKFSTSFFPIEEKNNNGRKSGGCFIPLRLVVSMNNISTFNNVELSQLQSSVLYSRKLSGNNDSEKQNLDKKNVNNTLNASNKSNDSEDDESDDLQASNYIDSDDDFDDDDFEQELYDSDLLAQLDDLTFDLSPEITEEELNAMLSSLKEVSSKDVYINIWKQAFKLEESKIYNLLKELFEYFESLKQKRNMDEITANDKWNNCVSKAFDMLLEKEDHYVKQFNDLLEKEPLPAKEFIDFVNKCRVECDNLRTELHKMIKDQIDIEMAKKN
ncbi:hypothetical protein MKS88_004054 [Plasmodium brasilianum]|uniref:Uncharacterized protein n=1 Tax=Plasmodium brasilianum TaxID=5824 RepID=A0ACB9Y6F0_PLABR|nr:hypothetical protein MKS88_004054 [Plasmodium brasilianum]